MIDDLINYLEEYVQFMDTFGKREDWWNGLHTGLKLILEEAKAWVERQQMQ